MAVNKKYKLETISVVARNTEPNWADYTKVILNSRVQLAPTGTGFTWSTGITSEDLIVNGTTEQTITLTHLGTDQLGATWYSDGTNIHVVKEDGTDETLVNNPTSDPITFSLETILMAYTSTTDFINSDVVKKNVYDDFKAALENADTTANSINLEV